MITAQKVMGTANRIAELGRPAVEVEAWWTWFSRHGVDFADVCLTYDPEGTPTHVWVSDKHRALVYVTISETGVPYPKATLVQLEAPALPFPDGAAVLYGGTL